MKAPTHGAALVAHDLSETFEAYVNAVGMLGVAEVTGATFRRWADEMARMAEYLAEYQDRWIERRLDEATTPEPDDDGRNGPESNQE